MSKANLRDYPGKAAAFALPFDKRLAQAVQVNEGEAFAYHILLYIFTYIITDYFTVNS